MKQKRLGMGCMLIVGAAVILLFSKRELTNAYFSTVKLQFLESYMDANYLYDIDDKAALEGIYQGYLEGLENSGTYYLNADELIAEKACAKGNYFGTGLKLMWSLDGHALVITGVVPNSSADKEGIQKGDQITEINGIPVLPANRKDIIEQVMSKKKIGAHYTIERGPAVMSIQLSPGEVLLEDYEAEVLDHILYVKMNAIKEGTSARLSQEIDSYIQGDNKGIILDVRDLQTDQVEEINKLCDLFLDGGVSFKVQTKSQGVKTFTTDDKFYDLPIAIITNSGTLSAAEALVLALREQATLIGSNTGGLIYIKKLVPFEDETGMYVASGMICDQYGEVLSKEGISPDIRLYLDEEDRLNMLSKGYTDIDADPFISSALDIFQ